MIASKKKAFTLIELLVVISIIALLVGILLPALGAARRSARAIVCQANMKNLTTAFVAYGTDHQGWWPGWATLAYSDIKNEHMGAWIPCNSLQLPEGTVDLADGSIWDYTPDYGVFSCPEDEYSHLSSGLSYTISNHLYRYVRRNPNQPSWAAITSMEPSEQVTIKDGATTVGTARYPQSDKIVRPSNFIFIVDEGGPAEDANLPGGLSNIGVNDGFFENLFSDLPGGNNSAGGADKTKWYHSDGATFGFGDGHAEVRKKSEEEIYRFDAGFRVKPTRVFEYGRIWDPAGQAPIIAGEQ